MRFSDYIAAVALVISAFSLYLSWRQYSRDRSHLRLSLRFELTTGQGSSYVLRVVNAGRRTANIDSCYARFRSGRRYPVTDKPMMLEETHATEVSIPLYGFRNSISHPLDLVAFEVRETTGAVHTIKTRKIRSSIRQLWTSEVDWLRQG